MPIKDLNEEQMSSLYRHILAHDRDPVKQLELKLFFQLVVELRDLNRRLADGIYIENEEELEERVRKEVTRQLNNQKESSKQ